MSKNARPIYFYTTRRWVDIISVLIPVLYAIALALILQNSNINYDYISFLIYIPVLGLCLRMIHVVTMDTALRSKFICASEKEVKIILFIQVLIYISFIVYKGGLFLLLPLTIAPFILPAFAGMFVLSMLVILSYPIILIIIKIIFTLNKRVENNRL